MAKANRRDVPFDWLIFIFRPARTFPCREHIIDETLWFSWVCGFPKLAYKLISTGDFLCWACSRVIFFAIFLSPFGAQCVLLCPSTRWWSWTVPPIPSHTDRSGSGRIHKGLRWRCTEDWMKQDWHIPLVSCVLLEMMPRCGPLRSIGTKSSAFGQKSCGNSGKSQRKCAKNICISHGMEYPRGSGIWRLSSKRKKGKSPSFPPPVTPPLRRGEVGEMIPVTPSEAFEWLPHALHRSCSQIQVLQRVCETRASG